MIEMGNRKIIFVLKLGIWFEREKKKSLLLNVLVSNYILKKMWVSSFICKIILVFVN